MKWLTLIYEFRPSPHPQFPNTNWYGGPYEFDLWIKQAWVLGKNTVEPGYS